MNVVVLKAQKRRFGLLFKNVTAGEVLLPLEYLQLPEDQTSEFINENGQYYSQTGLSDSKNIGGVSVTIIVKKI
ncbi:hypothetical protein [Enterococcus sp. DIV0086]|uniref:hypothetical protein n=1 Tax=Enterococcus sp. DIV0086 TaxID=2774655 RepID=UPI003D2E5C63